jgi:crotonobetainyl-CoA:carnitine CoA-transferase CaiB-like acyl-CoA transferase
MSYDAPYKGLKVVDLSQGVAGPYTGMLMAQHGADVIKVEPLDGDWARGISTRYEDHSAFSVPSNLGKRSIALDLKTKAAKTVVRQLLADSDVFIEGFRPGVIGRLGFGYEAVREANPGILYLSISGFGQTGPMAERPAMDPVLQAFTGMMSVNRGNDGIPHRINVIVCDMATALYAFQALSAALYAKRDMAQGRYLDVNLMQGTACLQVVRIISNYLDKGVIRPGRYPAGTFVTADGWMNILMLRDREWPPFCDLMERPELAEDPRYATNKDRLENLDALSKIVAEAFAKHDGDWWSERLAANGTMHEQVNDHLQFLEHPQVAATGLIAWIDQPGIGKVPIPNAPGLQPLVQGSPLAKSPTVGEHSAEILGALGYDAAAIADFATRGIVNASAAA